VPCKETRATAGPLDALPWWGRTLLLASPALLLLLGGELAVRVGRGVGLSTRSARHSTHAGVPRAYPAAHHPRLGWVPAARRTAEENPWRTTVTILPSSLRSNGSPAPPGPAVLALGDSYTFGDEVSDHETWPARLELKLGRPVLNGGVFAYGMDQAVLRGEELLGSLGQPVDTVVLSMIPDDVARCEFSYNFAWKPYFQPSEDDAQEPQNLPVPTGVPPESLVVRMLGYSHLADAVLRRATPRFWLSGGLLPRRVHDQGPAVAARLLRRLHRATTARGVRLVVLIQGHPAMPAAPLAPLRDTAGALGVEVVDAQSQLEDIARLRPDVLASFYRVAHLSPLGNDWTASVLAKVLQAPPPGKRPAGQAAALGGP
jgi:hypothetical protein